MDMDIGQNQSVPAYDLPLLHPGRQPGVAVAMLDGPPLHPRPRDPRVELILVLVTSAGVFL